MAIRATPTTYAGQRFRSTLEARWALFFDQLGIWWIYEPQRFTTNLGRYTPDFYLPTSDVHVEVKGSDWQLSHHFDRYERFTEEHGCSLLFLSPIADAGTGRIAVHSMVLGADGDTSGVTWFWHEPEQRWDLLPLLPGRCVTVEPRFIDGLSHDATVRAALNTARDAAFQESGVSV